MRLVDRAPRWLTTHDQSPRKLGVGFDCPCPTCLRAGTSGPNDPTVPRRINAWFENPPDGMPRSSTPGPGALYLSCSGDTFDTLTLTPSINAQGYGHWHGCVTNGALVGSP